MNEISLTGCRTRPLANYLKALGIFRILGEQLDPRITSRWSGTVFEIRTSLARDELTSFLLDRWCPSPIMAPWNGGSGFFANDFRDAINAISSSRSARLQIYRESIDLARTLLAHEGITEKPAGDSKQALITRLRNQLPDGAVRWIDAALLLTAESVKYPALLGTGGNDGRLEFTNNFMQRLLDLIDPDGRPAEDARQALCSAMFEEPTPGLKRIAVGQFSPLGAGGANTTTGFGGGLPTNSWDYVFMIEGALMFAASATRRTDTSDVRISYPFMVESSGSGSGGTAVQDDATTRAEIWLPLWSRFIGIREARRFFSEGRLTVKQRLARDGVDAIRAIGQYGTDRGVAAFERYQFSQRYGLAFLATPQGRIEVTRHPLVDLVAYLERDRWLDNVRRAARGSNATASLMQAVTRLENSIFELGQRGDVENLEELTISVGSLHRLIGRSSSLQERVRPVFLSVDWSRELASRGDDAARLAVALSLLGGKRLPILLNLHPVKLESGHAHWDPGSTAVVQASRLSELLSATLRRRLLERLVVVRENVELFDSGYGCDLDSWVRYFAGELDDERVMDLLYGLCLVREAWIPPQSGTSTRRVPAPLALLKLVVPHRPAVKTSEAGSVDGSLARLSDVVRQIRHGTPDRAIATAELFVRMTRRPKHFETNLQLPKDPGDQSRLLAALLIPLNRRAWRTLEREVLDEEQLKETTETDEEVA